MQAAASFQSSCAQWSFQDGKAGREEERGVQPTRKHGRRAPPGMRSKPETQISPSNVKHPAPHLEPEMHLRARTVLQRQPRAGLVQEQNRSVSKFYFQDGQLESRKKEKPEVEVGKAPAPCKLLLKHLSDQQVKQRKRSSTASFT